MAKRPAKPTDTGQPTVARRGAGRTETGDAPPGPEARIVVLHGPDEFLRGEHTRVLRESLAHAKGEVETVRFDGAASKPSEVLDECRTFGLMQQHKLVVVDDADQMLKEGTRDAFERYAREPAPDATLLLRARKWNPGKLDGLILDSGGAIVECKPPDLRAARVWMIARAKTAHGLAVEPAAADLLLQCVGPDLGRLDTELAKLAVAGAPSVAASAVRELVGMTREEDLWRMQVRLLTGSPTDALRFIREALEVSRHPPVLVSYACTDLARKLHGASRGLKARENPFALAGRLKLWGESKDAVLRLAARVQPLRAARLFAQALKVDHSIKTGAGDPGRSLETLALRFAALGA
ncbi:MAG: DNA polymerase III subunit delta [Phycisphaerae bacterium]|nr:DNA polymerase III subunit delta [Phycisphaerae bacterium]